MQRIEPTLYISYTREDKELVLRLAADLQDRGLRVRYNENLSEDQENRQSALANALVEADCVLVLITPNSVSSRYVMNELSMARGNVLNSEGQKLLLPVAYGKVNIPNFIRDVQVIFWREDYKEVAERIAREIFNFIEKRDADKADREIPQEQSANDSTTIEESSSIKQEREEAGSRKTMAGIRESEIMSRGLGTKSRKGKARSVSESPEKRNYWLLKMNPQTWDIEHFSAGYDTFFNTYFLGEKRPEYHLFSKIQKGDYVLGFASGSYQSIVCEMEVVKPVGSNHEWGESFTMVVKRLVDPRVPLSKFSSTVALILPRLEQDTKPPELFFHLSESEYSTILSSTGSQDETIQKVYEPFFLTEGNHTSTRDQLDFENDYNSFASVIALKRVNPPLAIGLFGNWGSGKSFFMEKLSQRIEELAESKDPDYVEHVVPVKFNSWHYSDTNLWASLTTQIFESLNDYAKKKQFGPDAINAIYKDLNITSHQLVEAKRKLDENKTQSTNLEEQKKNIEDVITRKKETLEIWKAKDLVRLVFSDPLIQKDFQNIHSQFGGEKLIEHIDQIDEKLTQIDTVRGQIVKSFTLLKENRKGKWIWVWVWAGLFGIIGWLALGPLKEIIQDYIKGGYIITGLVLAWLSNLITKLTPYFNKITQFYKRLKSLKQTIEKAKDNVRLKEHDEVERLQTDINRLVVERNALEMEQKHTEKKKWMLEKELEEIGSGKLLATFLAGKSADDAYIKQLGIVSWIRRDFSKLNDLFQKQKTVQDTEKGTKTEVQIDRIVLYIDDLDRCNEDVVVKVLEAIHLLLAFPLFVVVVGVDPRWLNNALSEKYRNLFGSQSSANDGKGNSAGQPNQQNIILAKAATSYDYLEKIFQIPFALKPINRTGREKLIRSLIKDEMEGKADKVNKPAVPSSIQEVVNKDEPTPTSITPQPEIDSPQEKMQKAGKVKERLVFTEAESAYMQKIASLFGQTPRSINRYVNIYRIIKAHGNLKVVGSFSEDEFMPLMFLLGVIVGHSEFAEQFIAEISRTEDTRMFREFLIGNKLDKKLVALIKPMASDIEAMPMEYFKRNLELVSRFSFRTLLN